MFFEFQKNSSKGHGNIFFRKILSAVMFFRRRKKLYANHVFPWLVHRPAELVFYALQRCLFHLFSTKRYNKINHPNGLCLSAAFYDSK